MRTLAEQMRRWGPLGVSLFTFAIVLLIGAAILAGPEGYRRGGQIVDPPPGIPDHLLEDLAQGCYDDAGNYLTEENCFATARPDLEGPKVGASSSWTYERPATWLQRAGIKFEWAPTAIWSPRGYYDPISIVVHVTGGGTCNGIRDYFKNNDRRVSAHFTVCEDKVIQQVETGDGAHHAGIWGSKFDIRNPMVLGWYKGGVNPNSVSIGIETLLNVGQHIDNYPEMRRGLIELIAFLGLEHDILITRDNVIGHFQIDGVNRAVDPICCMDLDAIVREAAQLAYSRGAPPAIPETPEWGETVPDGNRWNNWKSRWVAPNGDEYDLATATWYRNGQPEWGPTDPIFSNRWNNWLEVWVSPDGRSHFDPDEGFWRCVVDCETPAPEPTPEPTPLAGSRPAIPPEVQPQPEQDVKLEVVAATAGLMILAAVLAVVRKRLS